jgi:hypothetical protein
VKYSVSPRYATRRSRSYYTGTSSHRGSSGTTSRHTKSRLSPPTYYVTSSTTGTPTAESSNGQWSSGPSLSSSSSIPSSSSRRWWTSSPSGPRSRTLHPSQCGNFPHGDTDPTRTGVGTGANLPPGATGAGPQNCVGAGMGRSLSPRGNTGTRNNLGLLKMQGPAAQYPTVYK